jgi:hypothetical protein
MGGRYTPNVRHLCIGPEPIFTKDANMDARRSEDDRFYYQHRAEIEIERAQLATVPNVVQAHYQLAEAYLSKLATDEPVKAEAS